jgi:acetyltransferase-like isoleucine patch superfamily enzyme
MTPEEIKFFELIRGVSRARDDQLRREYGRSLPFGDALSDRWERARRLGFGEGVSIYDSACVFGEVQVGEKTWIGPYVMLDGSGGGITIGVTCSIAAGVHIYTHDTVHWALSGGRLGFRQGPVRIGDCCYIGSQSVIAAGVTIGRRCVVAANAFVNNDVEDNAIVGGTTARVIGRVLGEGEDVRLELFPDGQKG